MTRTGGLGVAASILLTVVLALGLLYAYRAQSPAIPAVPYSAALGAIQDGRVRVVEIEDGRATLTLFDGTRQQSTAADNGEALVRAVQDRNHADPAHPIDLRVGSGTAPNQGPVVLFVLLPVLALALPLLYIASTATRARRPQRYEALSRLADLRDRGANTEDEFLNEKRRLLK
jgi:hypothetical protein